MGNEQVETAPLSCSTEAVPGPSGLRWCTVSDPGASAAWVSPPSALEARVHVASVQNAAAGMAFSFDEKGTVKDLTIYDHLTFEGDFPPGVPFEVVVGRGRDRGCSFQQPTGAEQGIYSINLTNPAWCSPSLCDYDLHASGAYFLTSQPTASAEFAISSVRADTQLGAAGPVSAMQARIGPDGYCWFPFAWYDRTSARWEDDSTPDRVHVTATGLAYRTAGVAFELPAGFDASRYSRLEIDGTILPEGPFLVQLVHERRGMTWNLEASGTGTYPVDLRSTSVLRFGAPPMSVSEATRVEIATVYATGGTLDAALTAVRFVP